MLLLQLLLLLKHLNVAVTVVVTTGFSGICSALKCFVADVDAVATAASATFVVSLTHSLSNSFSI